MRDLSLVFYSKLPCLEAGFSQQKTPTKITDFM